MDAKQFIAEFGHIANAPGGIQRLRMLVLNLAASGKLTAGTSHVSAATFVEEINLNKKELISSKKIKANKKIQPLPETFPFEIPSNWRWVRFGSLCHFSAGKTPPRKESIYWNTGEYPWFSIADMRHQQVISKSSETISQEACDKLFKSEPVTAGTLLMSFKLTIGRLSILGVDGYHNEAIISIYPFSEILKEYFLKCLNGFDLLAGNKAAIKGNTLNQDSISNILVAIPPKEEIPIILAKVDELMALCDQLEAQQQKKRQLQNQLRQATLQAVAAATSPFELKQHWLRLQDNFEALFSSPEDVKELRDLVLDLAVKGLLVLQDLNEEPISIWLENVFITKKRLIETKQISTQTAFTAIVESDYPFVLPKGWAFARLGEFTNKVGSGSTPRGGGKVYLTQGIPFLRSQNVWNDGLKLQDVAFISDETHKKMSNTAVEANDLLLNITGASLGRCSLVPENFNTANVSQHVSIIRLTDPSVSEYLHLCMLSPFIQNMIWGRQVGMAREGLSKKVLEQFEIPLPPLKEQKRIVNRVSKLMKQCDFLEEKLSASNKLSKQLAATVIAEFTGINSIQEEEPLKVPQTELVAPVILGSNKPSSKDLAPLTALLTRHNGQMNATDLWQRFGGEIDTFYAQLKTEVAHGWLAEPSDAKMLEKDAS